MSYALLRDPPEKLAELREMDLLVWPHERERFADEANRLGFVRCRSRVPLKEIYVHCDGAHLYLLDVHYAMVQGGLVYLNLPDRSELVHNARLSLAREEAVLHLFFHSLLGKGGLQTKHLAPFRNLVREGLDQERLRRLLRNEAIYSLFDEFAAAPERFGAGMEEASNAGRRLRALLLRSPGNLARYLYGRFLLNWFRRRRGLHVAFLGVDGAGKSTTIECVARRLAALEMVPFGRVYMGPWGQFRTRQLASAYRWGFAPPEEQWLRRAWDALHGRGGSVFYCLSKWVRGQIRGILYYLAVAWDLWVRYLSEVRPRLRRGELVLSDRYVHDLRYLHYGKPITVLPLMRWLVCVLFPRPHIVFFLFDDPKRIHARKAQLEEDAVRQNQEIYRKALSGLYVVEVKTDRDVEDIATEIVRVAVERYFARR